MTELEDMFKEATEETIRQLAGYVYTHDACPRSWIDCADKALECYRTKSEQETIMKQYRKAAGIDKANEVEE